MLQLILERLRSKRLGEASRFHYQSPERKTKYCVAKLVFDFLYINWTIVKLGAKSILQEHCERRGFLVQILPKYHCELNPLEMVWGRSKFHYRLNPPSKNEADLHQNVINALAAVTLTEMRRYMISYSITNCTLIVSKIFAQICTIYGCLPTWTKWKAGCLGKQEVPGS